MSDNYVASLYNWLEGYKTYAHINESLLKDQINESIHTTKINSLNLPIEIYNNNNEILLNAVLFKNFIQIPPRSLMEDSTKFSYIVRIEQTIKYLLVELFNKEGLSLFLQSPLIENVFYVLTTNQLIISTTEGIVFSISNKVLNEFNIKIQEELIDSFVPSIEMLISEFGQVNITVPKIYQNIIELTEIESVFDFEEHDYKIPEPGLIIERYLPQLYMVQKECYF